MTATLDRPTVASTRSDIPLSSLSVMVGGALFAVGNAMHPLQHDHAALESPTWLPAHLVFGAGALFMAAGIGVLFRLLAPSRLAVVGLSVLWIGLVLMPIGSILEGYIARAMEHDAFHELETSLLWHSMLAGTSTITGPLLIAIGAIRKRLLPVPVALMLPAITVGALAVGVVPVEGYGIIPGTVLFGLGMAWIGWISRRTA